MATRMALIVSALVVTVPAVACAQGRVQASQVDEQDLLACYEAEHGGPARDGCEGLGNAVRGVLRHPENPTGARVGELLDGLESLALNHSEPRVRWAAITALVGAGRTNVPGIPDRLRRIYDGSDDTYLKRKAVAWAPLLTERESAVEFLRHVASDPHAPEYGSAVQGDALDALTRAGPPGRAALLELAASGSVTNPAALRRLRILEENGFETQ